LPLVDYYMVNEAPEIITRADYADDMLIRPIFDPKFSTQSQKVARSQAIAQVVMAESADANAAAGHGCYASANWRPWMSIISRN
jgi:hypothetical protein